MQARLDYALLSEKQIDILCRKDIDWNGHDIRFALYLSLNFNVNTRAVFKRKPSEIANELRFHPSFIYASMKKMNASGYAELFIENKKITGKLKHTAKEAFALETDEPPEQDVLDFVGKADKLTASMIDKNAVQLLIEAKLTPSQMLVALMLPLHCTLATGEVDEIRTQAIADRIGYHRTTVDRAIDRLNDIGYCQLKRDYVLSGRLNYTAYAYQQSRLKKEAKAAADANPVSTQNYAMKYAKAVELLKKGYGIVSEAFLKSRAEVVELAAMLSKKWTPRVKPDAPKRQTRGIENLLPFSENPVS